MRFFAEYVDIKYFQNADDYFGLNPELFEVHLISESKLDEFLNLTESCLDCQHYTTPKSIAAGNKIYIAEIKNSEDLGGIWEYQIRFLFFSKNGRQPFRGEIRMISNEIKDKMNVVNVDQLSKLRR